MKIFIAGPRAVSRLSKAVEDRLHGIYTKGYTVLVGDASGVDKAVQKYFAGLDYAHVIVYASGGKARNNIRNWPVEAVHVADGVKGFAFYAAKDKAMADDADYGFMIWNGESKGTLNNVVNLLNGGKKALVYYLPNDNFVNVGSFEQLEELLKECPEETTALYNTLNPQQISIVGNAM